MTVETIEKALDIGVTSLIVIGVLYFAFKYIPKLLEGYINRQKKYDKLMETALTVAQQGNTVIDRNNILLSRNNEVIASNTRAYQALGVRVDHALETVSVKVDEITKDTEEARKQTKKIHLGVEKLLDRTQQGGL